MKVLSLFDGISCGMVALQRADIVIDRYVAYEVDKYAISISRYNHEHIEQKGSVIGADFAQYIGFDLLLGGSPCQDLSIAKKDREGLGGEKSGLFWEYVRALKEAKPKYFLFENVASMGKSDKDIITEALGVEPIMIDSALVSAQSRRRLYWTNISGVEQPQDKGLVLEDIMLHKKQLEPKYWYKNIGYTVTSVEDKRIAGYLDRSGYRITKEIHSNKAKCSTLSCDGKGGRRVKKVMHDGTPRKLTPVEYERLQTLPDRYTLHGLSEQGMGTFISDTQRYNCIGNGWTVDIVAHILQNIKKGE